MTCQKKNPKEYANLPLVPALCDESTQVDAEETAEHLQKESAPT